jgi:thiamine biosynthesis protein ThiI
MIAKKLLLIQKVYLIRLLKKEGQVFEILKTSQEKVERLVEVLTKFQFRARLYMVPFAETQKEIVMNTPEKFRVIFYRRFMMRVAEALATRQDLKAIYTGESLGQVASQTLENMAAVQQAVSMPVLRPLIGLDKNEIIDIARKIGTYEISALPHDDACTRFMPDFPVIRAKIEQVLEAEQTLDVDSLVARDLADIEVVDV